MLYCIHTIIIKQRRFVSCDSSSNSGPLSSMSSQPAFPSFLPADKAALLQTVCANLTTIPGVRAVVLGGSYARATYHAASDLDVGIYYSEAAPFAIREIEHLAQSLALQPPTVTDFYAWGRWVNGGAWIHTAAGKLDFLYRNLDQVQRTIDESAGGAWSHDYDQQPAFGFYSVIYLAETRICLPLYDPDGLIVGLKQAVAQYPPRLKQRILSDSLWSAEFTLLHARGFATAGDVYAATGCLGRAAASLTQALYALNETYFINDKKAMAELGAFAILPAGYLEQLNPILAHPGASPAELAHSVAALESLWRQVVALCGDEYKSRYKI